MLLTPLALQDELRAVVGEARFLDDIWVALTLDNTRATWRLLVGFRRQPARPNIVLFIAYSLLCPNAPYHESHHT